MRARRFPDIAIHAIMGGLHLSGPNEAIIPQTVEGLKVFGIKTIAAGHCTGWRAMTALAEAFQDALAPPPSASSLHSEVRRW